MIIILQYEIFRKEEDDSIKKSGQVSFVCVCYKTCLEQLHGDSFENLKICLNCLTHLYSFGCIINTHDSILVALEQYQSLAQLCLSKSHPGTLCTQ